MASATDATAGAANPKKLAAFNEALKLINKHKTLQSETGTLIAKLSDRPLDVETISTGSMVLDSILGGGFPKGRIIEVFGAEASGKTSIALNAAANVQRDGGTVAFVDLENALDPRYAAKLGVKTDEMAVAQPDYAEQALELVEQLAASGVVDLIIVDSVAALVPKAELEGDMEQQTMAVVARLMSRALKKLVSTANRNKTTVIFINQIREKVGFVMGDPTVTPGGKALKFFASQRIRVSRTGQVKEGKDVIGNNVKMKVVKNKIAPPFGEGETVLTFNKGINRPAELVEVAPKYGVVLKPSTRSWVEAETGEAFASSKADAIEVIQKDEALFQRLTAALQKAIEEDLFNEKAEEDSGAGEAPEDSGE